MVHEDYELQRTGSLCQPPLQQLLEYVKINHIPKIKSIVFENPEVISAIFGHPYNKPILHIACYELADRIIPQTLNTLLDLQADLYYSDDVNNHKEALHFAVLGGNPNIIQAIIKRLGPNKINSPCGGGNTALNLLIKEGNIHNAHFLDNIRLLIRAGIDVNKPDDKNLTPIFWAAKKGYKDAVKVILHESKQNVDIDSHKLRGKSARDYMDETDFISNNNETSAHPQDVLFGYLKQFNEDAFIAYKNLEEFVDADDGVATLLQFSVKKGFAKAVEVLLENGANPNKTTQKTKETPIELAATEGLHVIFNLLLDNERTVISNNVLIELLKHIDSDITHVDINHNLCYAALMKHKNKIRINCPDKNKSTPLHYAARYGGSEKVLDLLRCGASMACRNKFGNLPVEDIDANTLETHFDECIETNLENNIDKENATVMFSYKTIMPPAKIKYNDDTKQVYDTEAANKLITNEIEQLTSETQVLSFISKSTELRHLLKHPLLTSFIYMKWHRIRWFFYVNLAFYIMFCLSLIFYTLLCYGSRDNSPTTIILRILLGTTFTLLILRELFQIAVSPKKYFLDVENWVELSLIALSGVILFDHSPSDDVTRQVSAFAILLAAFEMVLLIGQHPKMSTNIVMLRTVSINFFKFLLWYSVLIIAFSLSFYTLFKNKPKSDDDEQDFFVDPGLSLFKTIVMLTGEFDASDIQFQMYPVTSHIIFMLFVFMIAIVLFNLLNGLAVSDTQLIKSNAELVGHVARIEHVAYLESMLLGNILPTSCLRIIHKYCCCLPEVITNKITAPGILVKRVCLFPYFLKDYKMVVYPNQYGRVVCKESSEDSSASCLAHCRYVHLDKHSIKRTKQLIKEKKDNLERIKNQQIALDKQEEVLQQQQKYIEELKSQQKVILNKLDYIITNMSVHT